MGPIWDRQGPGGPHVGPMNFAIWYFRVTGPSWREFAGEIHRSQVDYPQQSASNYLCNFHIDIFFAASLNSCWTISLVSNDLWRRGTSRRYPFIQWLCVNTMGKKLKEDLLNFAVSGVLVISLTFNLFVHCLPNALGPSDAYMRQ